MFLSSINVELPLFLLLFRDFMTATVKQNLLIYRTCYITLGYSKSSCAVLGDKGNVTLEKLVQPTANYVITTMNVAESISIIIVALFVGTWSDKFGRKPVFVISFTGLFIATALETLYSYFEDLSPWFYILCVSPRFIIGGLYAFQTAAFAYLSDTTNEKNRSMRMAILEGCSILGSFVGTPAGTFLYKATNYVTLFGVATLLALIALLWNIFKIKESLEKPQKKGMVRGFFNFTRLKDFKETALKIRPRHKRSMIFLVSTAAALNIFVINGHLALQFLYLRAKLNWDITKYTYLSTSNSAQMVICSLVGTLLLTKLLRLGEVMAVCVALLLLSLGTLGMAIGTEDWHIFATGTPRGFFGVVNPVSTSFLSKLVDEAEVGTLMSLTAVLKCFFSLLAAPIYTAFYNWTLDKDPAYFNFLSLAILLTAAAILVWVRVMIGRYKPLEQEDKHRISNGETSTNRKLSLISLGLK